VAPTVFRTQHQTLSYFLEVNFHVALRTKNDRAIFCISSFSCIMPVCKSHGLFSGQTFPLEKVAQKMASSGEKDLNSNPSWGR
jgi:hypothetical protein